MISLADHLRKTINRPDDEIAEVLRGGADLIAAEMPELAELLATAATELTESEAS